MAKGTFVVDPNAKPLTDELLVKTLFGVSVDALVQDIVHNKDGKYDELYVDKVS